MSHEYDFVIFVARGSCNRRVSRQQAAEEFHALQTSLKYTKICYEDAYGPITGDWEFHEFLWPSTLELPEVSDTARFFAERTSKLEDTDKEMMIVLNGWDGLTAHKDSLSMLLRERASQITLRIFTDQPRAFYQVNVAQLFWLFDEMVRVDGEEEEKALGEKEHMGPLLSSIEAHLEYSTGLFYRHFTANRSASAP
ncbi:hypothetical protein N7539_006653 [Penicillium diatomitis]|uniref:Uncharacterized protein n=1 Tax=Penicillium diatomitis TaxID=2819901 RepID=A0A9W9X1J9_9EURO|nr:uncharacterized protein N7539_006653 [Penicillium diatomitis]KAJ5480759.1 hypothetical protein N7539_006653 [Penicillium diatomitis]